MTPTQAIAAIMHNVRELRVQTAMHTGESTGNLDVLERRIEDGIRVLAGLHAVQPELPEVERLAAQSAPTEPPQEFESAQGRALASAWAEGWAQCRDAEYVGEEAESEAFNQSNTLAQCLYADQTRFQGGLSNDQLRRAWSAKLPNVIPTDEQLTAFALGIEAAAQPLKAEQAKDAAEDAELLDWIFRQGDEFSYYVIQDAPGDGEYVVHGMGCSGQGKTPRAAIRAARAAERKA